jgi:hypothetical protein
MKAGVEAIKCGVLHDHTTRTYGMPDLLVRSDVLERLFPAVYRLAGRVAMDFIIFMLGVVIFVFLLVPALMRIFGWGVTGVVVASSVADARQQRTQGSRLSALDKLPPVTGETEAGPKVCPTCGKALVLMDVCHACAAKRSK